MAEKGCTIPQIKAISDHNSDSVLQGYIDNTRQLRMNSANILAFGTDNHQMLLQRMDEYRQERQIRQRVQTQQPVININFNTPPPK